MAKHICNLGFSRGSPICNLFLKHKFEHVKHLIRRYLGLPSPTEYGPRSLALQLRTSIFWPISPLLSLKNVLLSVLHALEMAKLVSIPAYINPYFTSMLLVMRSPQSGTSTLFLCLTHFYSTRRAWCITSCRKPSQIFSVYFLLTVLPS